MPSWLHTQRNPYGEWTVIDLERNYRLCSYNPDIHGGVHVHNPIHGPAGTVLGDIGFREGLAIVETYGALHSAFDLDDLKEVVKRWRSA